MFNESLLVDRGILKFFVDEVHLDLFKAQKDSVSLQDRLLHIVEQSKHEERLVVAAANAITILNLAEFNFKGKNLSGIRIDGANLNRALLESVDLSGASLKNVTFKSAWMRKAILTDANIEGVDFGEEASKLFDQNVTAVSYGLNSNTFAIGCQSG